MVFSKNNLIYLGIGLVFVVAYLHHRIERSIEKSVGYPIEIASKDDYSLSLYRGSSSMNPYERHLKTYPLDNRLIVINGVIDHLRWGGIYYKNPGEMSSKSKCLTFASKDRNLMKRIAYTIWWNEEAFQVKGYYVKNFEKIPFDPSIPANSDVFYPIELTISGKKIDLGII